MKRLSASSRNSLRAIILVCIIQLSGTSHVAPQALVFPEQDSVYIAEWQEDTISILRRIEYAKKLSNHKSDSAIILLRETFTTSNRINFRLGMTSSLYYLARSYQKKNMYRESLLVYQQVMRYITEDELPKVYAYIANTYTQQGKFQQAAFYLYQAGLLVDKHPSLEKKALYHISSYGLLSALPEPYQSTFRKMALYHINQAEKWIRLYPRPNIGHLSVILNNKGDLYGQEKNWDSSLHYAHASLDLADKSDDPDLIYLPLITLGEAYLGKHDARAALRYLTRARKGEAHLPPHMKIGVYINIGKAFLRLKRYPQAEAAWIQAKKDAEAFNDRQLVSIYGKLADLYHTTGNYRRAADHYKTYQHLKDHTARPEDINYISQLEVKYRTVQKDQVIMQNNLLILQQQHRLERQRRWIFIATGGGLFLFTLLAALYRSHRQRQRLQQEKIQNLQREKELDQLKAVMKGEEKERARIARELHDGIGGMLASIKLNLGSVREEHAALAQIGRLDDILCMLQDTTSEVRKTAHNLMPDVLNRNSLAEALVLYCDGINTGNNLEIDLQLHGDLGGLDKAVELVLYRITQELIQNIIKHAHATYAVIQIREHEEKLSIMAEDNGTGFDTEGQSGGFGLQNLRYRVQALQGNISIMSAKGRSTTIYIEFELEKLKLAGG